MLMFSTGFEPTLCARSGPCFEGGGMQRTLIGAKRPATDELPTSIPKDWRAQLWQRDALRRRFEASRSA